MNSHDQNVWDSAIRRYDRKVFLSLLALGLSPEQAREIAQTTWTKLMEKKAEGELDELQLPGLAIRQARFLALNDLQRRQTQQRVLAAVPDPGPTPDVEQIAMSRQQLDRILDALAECSPIAKRIFRLVYASPRMSHAETARTVGLSLQRVRQTLCETRKHIRHAIERND